MIAVVQRVLRAEVRVDENNLRESIGPGLMILLGVALDDLESDADFLAGKISSLRIFEDSEGKMNLSVKEARNPPAALIVSQFTLLGNSDKGRRPSYSDAAPPEKAIPLYERFCQKMEEQGIIVKTGIFGAHMEVELINNGPVTLIVRSQKA